MQDDKREEAQTSGALPGTETAPAGGRFGRWLPTRWFTTQDVGVAVACDAESPDPARAPNQTPSREGEATRLWFRTDRVFFQDGGWYISTREGLDVGPYADAKSARREAKQLIELLIEAEKSGAQAQALTIQQFMYRPRLGNRR